MRQKKSNEECITTWQRRILKLHVFRWERSCASSQRPSSHAFLWSTVAHVRHVRCRSLSANIAEHSHTHIHAWRCRNAAPLFARLLPPRRTVANIWGPCVATLHSCARMRQRRCSDASRRTQRNPWLCGLEGGAVYRDVYQCFRVFVAAWIDSSAQVSQELGKLIFSSLHSAIFIGDRWELPTVEKFDAKVTIIA